MYVSTLTSMVVSTLTFTHTQTNSTPYTHTHTHTHAASSNSCRTAAFAKSLTVHSKSTVFIAVKNEHCFSRYQLRPRHIYTIYLSISLSRFLPLLFLHLSLSLFLSLSLSLSLSFSHTLTASLFSTAYPFVSPPSSSLPLWKDWPPENGLEWTVWRSRITAPNCLLMEAPRCQNWTASPSCFLSASRDSKPLHRLNGVEGLARMGWTEWRRVHQTASVLPSSSPVGSRIQWQYMHRNTLSIYIEIYTSIKDVQRWFDLV